MLTAQQAAIDANPDHEFYSLNIDAGGMWVRRILDRDARGGERRRRIAGPVAVPEAARDRRQPPGLGDRRSWSTRTTSRPDVRRITRARAPRPRRRRRARTSTCGCRCRRATSRARTRSSRARTAARCSPSACCGRPSRGAARRTCTGWRAGDELATTRPLQNFPLRVGAPRYVLLAGGIGITALSAMAEVLRRAGADYTLVYVGRGARADGLPRRARGRARRPPRGARRAARAPGRPPARWSRRCRSGRSRPAELYVCGPIRLMDAVRGAGRRRAAAANLRFETFGSGRPGPARGSSCGCRGSGVETTVGTDETLLDALAARRRRPVMYDCLKGECGLCVLRRRGRGRRRRPPGRVPQPGRSASPGGSICACVSRVVPRPGRRAASSARPLPVSRNRPRQDSAAMRSRMRCGFQPGPGTEARRRRV